MSVFSKAWLPSMPLLHEDLTAYKVHILNIHDAFIEAGLVQTDTPGQMVVQELQELPPKVQDPTYTDFLEYELNDFRSEEEPITIRLYFSRASESGYSGASNPIDNAAFGYRMTIVPDISIGDSPPIRFNPSPCSTYRSSAPSTTPTWAPTSTECYITRDSAAGFFGVCISPSTRSISASVGEYRRGEFQTSTITIFIARLEGGGAVAMTSGVPSGYTASGFRRRMSRSALSTAFELSTGLETISTFGLFPRLDTSYTTVRGGGVPVFPITTQTDGGIVNFPGVVIVPPSVGVGALFTSDISGEDRTYISLGKDTGIFMGNIDSSSTSLSTADDFHIAMLFEE